MAHTAQHSHSKRPMKDSAKGFVVRINKFFSRLFFEKLSQTPASLMNKFALVLTGLGILSGIATYAALGTTSLDSGGDPDTVFWLLNLNLIILLILVMLVAHRLVSLFSGRRRGIAGARLHVRLVSLFSLLAVAPAIIMAVFSAFFFHYGIQSWFSSRIQTAVTESQAVAEAYLDEHTQVIRADILGMANDLERQASLLAGNQKALNRVVQSQSFFRNFSEVVLFDSQGRVLASAGITFNLDLSDVPDEKLALAEGGEVAVMTGESDDRVRALIKLNNFVDTYLFVGRLVDNKVLAHVDATRQAVEAYTKLEGRRSSLQVTFLMIYVVVALLLLLAAIWLGLVFARRLVTPIGSIISAAERVRAGDLTARVPVHEGLDEFDYLSKSFNRMTQQIQQQRDELVHANRQLDDRRRFTETVLAGVSSGVIGIDDQGNVMLANSTACDLLDVEKENLIGRKIQSFIPETSELIEKAFKKSSKVQQMEIPYKGEKDKPLMTFLARVAVSQEDEAEQNAVLTLDDITGLLSAQRKAAWADVARRIAHEIKNPLTPIQLSAERLQRKYLSQIDTDQETFKNCVQTIIKHVSDIGHMVNEFSSFARMPEPVFRHENLGDHIYDIVVFEQQVYPDIEFNMHGVGPGNRAIYASYDPQKLRQALMNVLQNAADSIRSRIHQQKSQSLEPDKAIVDIVVTKDAQDMLHIIITDNGMGFPQDVDLMRLTDPYVTRREKGTGLGLAIVKKIMEDHRGEIVLGTQKWNREIDGWRDLGGATVILTLPLDIDISDSREQVRHHDNTDVGPKSTNKENAL